MALDRTMNRSILLQRSTGPRLIITGGVCSEVAGHDRQSVRPSRGEIARCAARTARSSWPGPHHAGACTDRGASARATASSASHHAGASRRPCQGRECASPARDSRGGCGLRAGGFSRLIADTRRWGAHRPCARDGSPKSCMALPTASRIRRASRSRTAERTATPILFP
jgi:hypothetical protein